MPENSPKQRQVWSCRLCPPVQEDEAQQLEEQLLARDLDIWDDARALQRYIRLSHLTQAACARRLDRSQAAVANRLRILKLPEEVRKALRDAGLTERHARALLRITDVDTLRRAAAVIVKNGCNVAEAEALVDAMLSPQSAAASLRREQRESVGVLWEQLSRLQGRCPGLSMELREEQRSVVIILRLPKA